MTHTRLYTIIGSLVLIVGLIYGVSTISVGQESHDASAWSVRCDEDDAGKKTYCEMYSTVSMKETGALVAEVAIGFPEGTDQAARGVISLPLGMLLPPGGKLKVDENEEVYGYAMQTCTARACVSMIDVKQDLLDQLKKGESLIVAFNLGGKNVNIKIPLKGFVSALKTLNAPVK